MVSLRRHFVPNPVPFMRTGFRPECQSPLFLHTRYDAEGNRTSRFVWTDADTDGRVDANEKSEITEYTWDARNRRVKGKYGVGARVRALLPSSQL